MLKLIKAILDDSRDPRICDITVEGAGDDEHLIVTLDVSGQYQLVRLDIEDLGEDYLGHD